MRRLSMMTASVGASAALACTYPNPGFLAATDGATSTAGGSSSTTRPTTVAETTDTADPTTGATSHGALTTTTTTTTSTTEPVETTTTTTTSTTDPVDTTSSSGSTSTEGDSSSSSTTAVESTGGVLECEPPPDDDLSLIVTQSFSFDCLNSVASHVEVDDQIDATTWRFRECLTDACQNLILTCPALKTFTVKFDGPLELVPKLEPDDCYDLSYIPAAKLQANVCSAKILRLSKLGEFSPPPTYVGAVDVAATATLPVNWQQALEFTVSQTPDVGCDGANMCGLESGLHKLKFQVKSDPVAHTVLQGGMQPESIPEKDNKNNPLLFPGVFHNVRSFVLPDQPCATTGFEFKWVWIDDAI